MAVADRLELVVVRHGVTAWNLERRYQGQRDIALLWPDAEAGLTQLREALASERFDSVYCSDLQRCRQSLAYVLAAEDAVGARFDSRLRELDFGEFEGRCYDELKHRAEYRLWIDSRGERAPPGGESAADMRARLDRWWADVFTGAEAHGRRRVLAVAHGGVIREIRRRFERIDFWDGTVDHAEGRRLVFEKWQGEWRCTSSSAVPARASTLR